MSRNADPRRWPWLVLVALGLGMSPAHAEEDVPASLVRTWVRGDLAAVETLLSRAALHALQNEHGQAASVLTHLVDGLPCLDVGPEDDALVRRIRSHLEDAFPPLDLDNPLRGHEAWARAEATYLGAMLGSRAGLWRAEVDGPRLMGAPSLIARAHAGGAWLPWGFERAHEILMRSLHHANADTPAVVAGLAHLRKRMDDAAVALPESARRISDAHRILAEAILACRADPPRWEDARAKVRAVQALLRGALEATPGALSAIQLRNDVAHLQADHAELQMDPAWHRVPLAKAAWRGRPELGALSDVVTLPVPLSRRWRVLPATRGGLPASHLLRTTARGTLLHQFTVGIHPRTRRQPVVPGGAALRGSQAADLAVALARAVPGIPPEAAPTARPGAWGKHLKGGMRCVLQRSGSRIVTYAQVLETHAIGITWVRHSAADVPLLEDVQRFLDGVAPTP